MYSFYGGKQGRTYHIVERFDLLYIDFSDTDSYPNYEKSKKYKPGDYFQSGNMVYFVLPISNDDTTERIININEELEAETIIKIKGMVNEFQKGGAYTDVNYGEYVIIDTILNLAHKSDDLNGLLYRRGMDYTEEATKAKRPKRDDDKYWSVDGNGNKVFHPERWIADWTKYVTHPGGGAIYVGQIVGPKGDSPQLFGESWSTYTDVHAHPIGSTVALDKTPGLVYKNNTPSFNDDIKFGSTSVYDDDGDITGAHISFDIPYPVFRTQAVQVNPYTFSTDLSTAASTATNNRLIHKEVGNSTTRWLPYENSTTSLIHDYPYDTVHPFYHDLQIAVPHGKKGTSIENVSTGRNNQDHNYVYLQYKTRNYDNNAAGAVSAASTIAKYNIISNMATTTASRNPITLNTASSELNIGDYYEYNGHTLICIKSGYFNSSDITSYTGNWIEGDVIVHTRLSGQDQNTEGEMRVCILPTPAPAALTTSFTAAEPKSFALNNVDYLYMSKDGGVYTAYTNSPDEKIGSIKGVNNINYKNGIDEIQPHVHIQYNDDTSADFNQHNMVVAIDRQGDDLIILYSSAGVRQQYLEKDQYELGRDYFLKEITENIYQKFKLFNTSIPEQEYYYDTIDKNNKHCLVWVNFGSMGSQYHVFGDYQSVEDVLTYIPNGFEDPHARAKGQYDPEEGGGYEERSGWIISIVDENDGHRDLYAYDYTLLGRTITNPNQYPTDDYLYGENKNHQMVYSFWYKLQDLSAAGMNPKWIIQTGDPENETDLASLNQLNIDGICFVTSQTHSHANEN